MFPELFWMPWKLKRKFNSKDIRVGGKRSSKGLWVIVHCASFAIILRTPQVSKLKSCQILKRQRRLKRQIFSSSFNIFTARETADVRESASAGSWNKYCSMRCYLSDDIYFAHKKKRKSTNNVSKVLRREKTHKRALKIYDKFLVYDSATLNVNEDAVKVLRFSGSQILCLLLLSQSKRDI